MQRYNHHALVLLAASTLHVSGCADIDTQEPIDVDTPRSEATDDIAEATQALHIDAARKDFNRDGRTDVLWWQPATGRLSPWLLNGTTVIGNPLINWTAPLVGWWPRGTGDFDADGQTDVMWWHPSDGAVSIWFLNGVTVTRNADLNWRVPDSTGWSLHGTGDFNRDGRTDVVWWHAEKGEVSLWLLNGTTVAQNPILGWGAKRSDGWDLAGTGDFNRDGNSDLLWYNSVTREVNTWLLSGSNIIGNPTVDQLQWGTRQLVGTGDYNGDGHTDLLWLDRASATAETWLLAGTHFLGSLPLSPQKAPEDWIPVSR